MVELTNISKWYHGQTRVLDTINLKLKKGEFLYLVGGSGAGKSSLLRMLATEEAPSSGTISLFGYNLATVNPVTLRAIRKSVGYVPQNVRLIPDFTVFENVAVSLSLAGNRAIRAEAKVRINDLLDRLGLAEKKEKLGMTLSGGEAQRVAIARALIRMPELIVADEPTGAQDKENTWSLMDLLLKFNITGSTMVIATHDREIVRRVRKRCAILDSGRMNVEETVCTY